MRCHEWWRTCDLSAQVLEAYWRGRENIVFAPLCSVLPGVPFALLPWSSFHFSYPLPCSAELCSERFIFSRVFPLTHCVFYPNRNVPPADEGQQQLEWWLSAKPTATSTAISTPTPTTSWRWKGGGREGTGEGIWIRSFLWRRKTVSYFWCILFE